MRSVGVAIVLRAGLEFQVSGGDRPRVGGNRRPLGLGGMRAGLGHGSGGRQPEKQGGLEVLHWQPPDRGLCLPGFG